LVSDRLLELIIMSVLFHCIFKVRKTNNINLNSIDTTHIYLIGTINWAAPIRS